MFYDNTLYQNIMQKHLVNTKELNVISGFASPEFLEKIIDEFPNVKINLFIGMSQLGISIKQHTSFNKIMRQNDNVRIYYQITGAPTHIKLVNFKKSDNTSVFYNGSANFTLNGYTKWHEAMSEVDEIPNNIFKAQKLNSRLCNNENILDYINILDESISLLSFVENAEIILNQQDLLVGTENARYNLNGLKLNRNTFKSFKESRLECQIPVIFENEKTSLASVNDANPYLKQSNNSPFSNFFKFENKIKFIADDNNVFYGYLDSKNRLRFDINIHDYLCYRLNLDDNSQISLLDLLEYGRRHILISKLDEDNVYYFDFSKNN